MAVAVVEARHVGVFAADAAVVARCRPVQRRHEAARMEAHLLAEVAADDVAAVADAVRIGRVEVELSRMRVVSTQLAPITTTLPSTCRSARSCGRSTARRFARPVVVHQHARDDGVGADLELAGLQGVGQQVVGRAEERRRVAAAAALPAVMARRKAVVRHRLDCATDPHERHLEPLSRARQRDLTAAHLRRRQEVLAARQRVGIVVATAHADQLIDLVVVRRDVGCNESARGCPSRHARRRGSPSRCSAG